MRGDAIGPVRLPNPTPPEIQPENWPKPAGLREGLINHQTGDWDSCRPALFNASPGNRQTDTPFTPWYGKGFRKFARNRGGWIRIDRTPRVSLTSRLMAFRPTVIKRSTTLPGAVAVFQQSTEPRRRVPPPVYGSTQDALGKRFETRSLRCWPLADGCPARRDRIRHQPATVSVLGLSPCCFSCKLPVAKG
jgi:hypothetical protein